MLYLNFIILTDRDVTDVVLLTEFLGQGSGHQLPANVRRSTKVTLAVLAPRRGNVGVQFHYSCPETCREEREAMCSVNVTTTDSKQDLSAKLSTAPTTPLKN